MRFVTISRCGRINIDDVRNKNMIEKIQDKIDKGETIERRLSFNDRIATSRCIECKHSTVTDEITKYGNKVVSCSLLVLQDDGKIPPDWIDFTHSKDSAPRRHPSR